MLILSCFIMDTTILVILAPALCRICPTCRTCSRVSILIVWSKVCWTNLREKRTRTVNATSLNLWSTATMVLTHQLEVLHGQLTRLSQVKLNPKKKSWSFVIDYWSVTKQVKVNPKKSWSSPIDCWLRTKQAGRSGMVIQRLGSNLRVDLSEPPQRRTFIRCLCIGLSGLRLSE